MAVATLVGGAILSGAFNVLFDRMSSHHVVDFFILKKHNERLLEKLRTRLNTIGGVLDDAEKKQITMPAVKNWMVDLRNAVYEADDLLDEVAYEAIRLEEKAGSHPHSHQFLPSIVPRAKWMAKFKPRLKDILETLDDLLKQMDHLGLERDAGLKPSVQKVSTTSLVDESGVFARENDKEEIIKLLLSDEENGRSLGVVPIVGMGGVGKTTLAQLVYNDSRVKEQFKLRAWICVSEEMDFRKVTKDILSTIGLISCDDMSNDVLHRKLQEVLTGKKVLLVLDDVWSENEAEWESCLIPFNSVTKGSKIIVTTRSERVASVKSIIPSYHLQVLPEEDCWFLFANQAFSGGCSSVDLQLESVGRELVKKCRGLPLALKTLGSQLCFNRDVEEWEKILSSDIWDLKDDKILPALRLSYYSLPSHLKECFAYCALFPKDYKFEKKELVLLWMAEGFLVQPTRSKEMVEIGDEYFNDLVSRSFLQASSGYYIMHDLMHDLAESIHGEFCIRLEYGNSRKPIKTTRHLSEYCFGSYLLLTGNHEPNFLRTLLIKSSSTLKLLDFPSHLEYLRVLSLPHLDVSELPYSIHKLKHLRYLDLSHASILELPGVVCTLFNLQTLILNNCKQLTVLPISIDMLKCLQFLDLDQTPIKNLPESTSNLAHLQTLILNGPIELGVRPDWCYSELPKFKAMPSNMGKLTKLKKLSDFVVGERSGSGIKELGKLHHLHETLRIWNLQNVEAADHGDLRGSFTGMKYLQGLELHWGSDARNSEHVLEQLKPHTNLKLLVIEGYRGALFPGWVGASSFSNVASLYLGDCKTCSCLPPLGQLEALKDLYICRFPRVETVGPEFYGSCGMRPFRCLESLTIEDMPMWKEWISESDQCQGSASPFPRLQYLTVRSCGNLIKALPSHLPSLTKRDIYDCGKLIINGGGMLSTDNLSNVDRYSPSDWSNTSSNGHV